ncbi:MAG: 5-formyltetrahydrofolate cyclo-ligase, partial [Gammaproteobacteria bacterium]|nr:5-formyltetrahydrofolate cyclo-ligase [Gammaproteobacteria bacterium]
HLAFYYPAGSELDTGPLIEAASRLPNKTCYLPVLGDRLDRLSGTWMHFQRYDPQITPLVSNRYSIAEPVLDPAARRPICMLDVVFVPLVAFDNLGHRLGMGQGYYDRTLDTRHTRWRKPLLVGLAHSIQQAQTLKTNPWDVPMDLIVTEKEIIQFCKGKQLWP